MNKILTTIRMDADIKDALTKLCKGPYNQTYVIGQALRAYQPLMGVLHAPAGMGKHKMSDLPRESKLGANIVNSEQKQNINWINPWDLCVGDQITLSDGTKVTVTDNKPKAVKKRKRVSHEINNNQ